MNRSVLACNELMPSEGDSEFGAAVEIASRHGDRRAADTRVPMVGPRRGLRSRELRPLRPAGRISLRAVLASMAEEGRAGRLDRGGPVEAATLQLRGSSSGPRTSPAPAI